jgi:hypothetical protein
VQFFADATVEHRGLGFDEKDGLAHDAHSISSGRWGRRC